MTRRLLAVLVAGALAAGTSAACSGGAPAAPVASGSATPALEQPSTRCGPPQAPATTVAFAAADGTALDGVLVGTGTAGVVLVHESAPGDLCGFWPYANYLAQHHLLAFAIDLRCFGRSACPEGTAAGRVVDDIAAAAAELRRRGATAVAVVGASMGGAAALLAGARVTPALAAVVSLSGEPDPTGLVGIPLDTTPALPRLTVPTLLAVASNDQFVTVAETRAMYRAVRATDKRLLALSGEFDGRHGWELLQDRSGAFTSVAAQVAAFLDQRLRR